MTNPTGFLEIDRHDRGALPIERRLKNFDEFVVPLAPTEMGRQAARCMDCGVPFCHTGCPVNNLIPDWNDLVSRDQWRTALDPAPRTNIPGIHGRSVGAVRSGRHPQSRRCDGTIKSSECEIVDRGWREAGSFR